MTTGNKRWWRAVAVAAVTGGVIGGWFGFARPQAVKADKSEDETTWTRAATTTPSPAVTEVARTPDAAPSGAITLVGGMLPIPAPGASGPVVPAIPAPPVLVPAAPLAVPPPGLPAIEPVAGPRVSDSAFLATDKTPLPVVPALPPAELPPLPAPPKTPDVKPVTPAPDMAPRAPVAPVAAVPPMPAAPMLPALPPLPAAPMTTAEPPKAVPLAPPTPVAPPVDVAPKLPVPPAGMAVPPVAPAAPPAPVLPQPVEIAPSLPPAKPADPVQPMLPAKPDSDLKPTDPPITLNPSAPQVAPAVPIVPGVTARETPGTVVDRPKPPEPNFGTSDKFVFPLPVKPPAPNPLVPHQRDDTMFKLTTTAALAVLGGAMLAGDKAAALPAVPPSQVIPVPGPGLGLLVKADDKTDIENLKKDLKDANKKIEELEKDVKKLTELLGGKREAGVLVDPNAPGAVAEVKKLKDDIFKLQQELDTLKKTQTALKPLVVAPEVKPKGIVKIINEYPVEITMMINDKAPTYRVAPGATLEVEVPAGEFTYQLLQSGAPATRSVIKDKEVVKLRIK